MNDCEILRAIGSNVRKARIQAEMTQECLAEILGVHWQTVSHLENGKYPYPIMRLAHLCHALDVDANCLLAGLPKPNCKQRDLIKKALARKRSPRRLKS